MGYERGGESKKRGFKWRQRVLIREEVGGEGKGTVEGGEGSWKGRAGELEG